MKRIVTTKEEIIECESCGGILRSSNPKIKGGDYMPCCGKTLYLECGDEPQHLNSPSSYHSPMQLKMYKYRLYPSKSQQQILFRQFDVCKAVYNSLLEQSIATFKVGGKTLHKYDFNKLFKGKADGVYSQVLQNVSDRVHKAYSNFFHRVKDTTCREKGFPRFKSRVQSITFPQAFGNKRRKGFWFISDKRLYASKIGNIPIVLHRVPKGKIKTLTIKRNRAGQWFAIFACELPDVAVRHPSAEKVGIDVGLENFATLSNGETAANPHFLVKAEKRLKLLNRRLSRKKKGSRNRGKARFRLARQYNKVANQRTDFLHKLSHRLTTRFGGIAVEDLQIANMVKNHHLAHSISDASWGTFVRMLEYKAVTSGSSIMKVNPRGTSQMCSSCGAINKMPLSKRQLLCSNCNFACHRDLNASLNINDRAGLARITPVDIEPLPSQSGMASSVVEAGTILDGS